MVVTVTNPFGQGSANFSLSGEFASLDPATAIDMTISNNDLTATNDTDSMVEFHGVKSTMTSITGKYYIEFDLDFIDTALGGSGMGVGIDDPSTTYENFSFNEAPLGAVIFIGGEICINNSIIANLVGFPNDLATGSVIGMAVDLGNNLVWFAIVDGPQTNLNWNANGGNPALGTGGFSIPPTASKAIFITFEGNEGSSITVNLGTGFEPYNFLPPPAGFTNWPSPP